MSYLTILFLALPVASISLTTSRAKVFAGFRTWVAARSEWLGKLVECTYCTSHWVAFLAVAFYRPNVMNSDVLFVDLIASAFAVVALAAPMAGLMFIALQKITPDETIPLREALAKARDAMIHQSEIIKIQKEQLDEKNAAQ